MRAVVTVVGADKKGIIGKVSGALCDMDINIEEISQTILQEYFTMMMIVDMADCKISFADLQKEMDTLGETAGVKIHVMNIDIFNAMHKI